METIIKITHETGEQLIGHLMEITDEVKKRLPLEVEGPRKKQWNSSNCSGDHFVSIRETD